jgi:AraC-like DNA-binding protein
LAIAITRGDDAGLEQKLESLAPVCEYKVLALAQRLGISERQLRRMMRASLGMSPSEWLRRQRMSSALAMLVHASSVKEVALALGFQEVSQFSRDFRLRFACSPSAVLRAEEKLAALQRRGDRPRNDGVTSLRAHAAERSDVRW